MPSQGRNYHIEQIENEDKKERLIDGVKSANKTQDRVIFGKPKVGKTIAKIYGTIVLVLVLTIAVLLVFDVFPNEHVDYHYTITYVTNGGTEISTTEYDETKVISLSSTYRDGYIFIGWYFDAEFENPVTSTFLKSLENHGDLTVYAKWISEDTEVTITFDTCGGSIISPMAFVINSDFSTIIPIKGNLYFAGWFSDPNFNHVVTQVPFEDTTLYALWSPVQLVAVGNSNQNYTIPDGNFRYNYSSVYGGFLIAQTETTYPFWYEVRIWAEANEYHFIHLGTEGNDGQEGALPTVSHFEPVTHVSYLDVVVWLNALSEKYGFNPVYRNQDGTVIKDARLIEEQTSIWVNQTSNGYRLPTKNEWEMSARWTNLTSSSSYTVQSGSRFWTNGDYVSGSFNNLVQSLVSHAWYEYNSQNTTHEVGLKDPNILGIYDMSGNVSEWCFSVNSGDIQFIKGGSYITSASNLGISRYSYLEFDEAYHDVGFRIAMGVVND